jgi:hypothetical protein
MFNGTKVSESVKNTLRFVEYQMKQRTAVTSTNLVENQKLQQHIIMLRATIQDFIDKVEGGRAQSRDSYAKFKVMMDATNPKKE